MEVKAAVVMVEGVVEATEVVARARETVGVVAMVAREEVATAAVRVEVATLYWAAWGRDTGRGSPP